MLMLIVMHMCIGIFRLTGAKLDVLSLYGRLMIDQQSSMAMSPLVAERDIHVVATVTKALLRRLPETLLTSSLYSTIMAAPLLTPSSAAILALRNAIGALPPDNRGVLQSLITCCCQLVSNTSTTKMEAGNLAVVVGAAFLPNDDPSLLIGVKNSMSPLFYYFIHHYESIFGVAPPCGPIAPLDNATVTALLAAATNAASSRASAPLLPSASFTYGPKHSHSLPSSFSLSSISPPTGAVTATGSGVTATTSGSGHQTSPSLGSLGATNTAFSQSPPPAAPSSSGDSTSSLTHTPMKTKPLTALSSTTSMQRLAATAASNTNTSSTTDIATTAWSLPASSTDFYGGVSTPSGLSNFELTDLLSIDDELSVNSSEGPDVDTPQSYACDSPVSWCQSSAFDTVTSTVATTIDDLPPSPMVLPTYARISSASSNLTVTTPLQLSRGTKRSMEESEPFSIAPRSWDVGRVVGPITLTMRTPAPLSTSSNVSVMFGSQSVACRVDNRSITMVAPLPPLAFSALAVAGHASAQHGLRLRVRLTVVIDGINRWTSYFHYRMGGDEDEPEVPDPVEEIEVDAAPCDDEKTPITPSSTTSSPPTRVMMKGKRSRVEPPVHLITSFASLDAVTFQMPPSPSVVSTTSTSSMSSSSSGL
jgi:hypothetical protein